MIRVRVDVARGLAFACLAGPWERSALRERAIIALGRSHPWLEELVASVLRQFAEPPHHDSAALVKFIAGYESLELEAWSPSKRPRIVHWFPSHARSQPLRFDLPLLDTVDDIARLLDVSETELSWFADRSGRLRSVHEQLRHYTGRWIPKRSGGFRLVEAPKSRLKALQRTLLHRIVDRIPTHDAAHGFVRGRSVHTHASPHVQKCVVMRFDLEDFFASVAAPRVYGVFRTCGYADEVARVLTALCTHRTPHSTLLLGPKAQSVADLAIRAKTSARLRALHLPQGAPTSPALANLVAFRLDARLAGAARALGVDYTRYADDITLSGDAAFSARGRRFQTFTTRVVHEEGFALNLRKTRLMTAGRRQEVVGLVVNRRPSVRREVLDALRATLHNCATQGPASQNHAGHGNFREHLQGRVSWVEAVSPEKGRKIRAMFERITW